jgi:hypothetical protein
MMYVCAYVIPGQAWETWVLHSLQANDHHELAEWSRTANLAAKLWLQLPLSAHCSWILVLAVATREEDSLLQTLHINPEEFINTSIGYSNKTPPLYPRQWQCNPFHWAERENRYTNARTHRAHTNTQYIHTWTHAYLQAHEEVSAMAFLVAILGELSSSFVHCQAIGERVLRICLLLGRVLPYLATRESIHRLHPWTPSLRNFKRPHFFLVLALPTPLISCAPDLLPPPLSKSWQTQRARDRAMRPTLPRTQNQRSAAHREGKARAALYTYVSTYRLCIKTDDV